MPFHGDGWDLFSGQLRELLRSDPHERFLQTNRGYFRDGRSVSSITLRSSASRSILNSYGTECLQASEAVVIRGKKQLGLF